MKKSKNNNGIFLIILLLVVCVFVLFFPKINDLIISISMPKVKTEEKKEVDNKKEINEDILETIHFPIMRTSIYNSNTYYSLEKFTISNLSNNDILLNAFLDIYEGNMTSYESTGACTTVSKQFNEDYLKLRIKNILGNKISYTLENFYVPESLDSNYVGNWNYDSSRNRFVYVGLCQSQKTNIQYYDLEQLIKMEYDQENEEDINAYYYVGFAKVEGNNYTIYKDPGMTKELKSGSITQIEELDTIFESIDNKNKQIYKYKFKNTLCSYNEYCLYEGTWIDEL